MSSQPWSFQKNISNTYKYLASWRNDVDIWDLLHTTQPKCTSFRVKWLLLCFLIRFDVSRKWETQQKKNENENWTTFREHQQKAFNLRNEIRALKLLANEVPTDWRVSHQLLQLFKRIPSHYSASCNLIRPFTVMYFVCWFGQSVDFLCAFTEIHNTISSNDVPSAHANICFRLPVKIRFGSIFNTKQTHTDKNRLGPLLRSFVCSFWLENMSAIFLGVVWDLYFVCRFLASWDLCWDSWKSHFSKSKCCSLTLQSTHTQALSLSLSVTRIILFRIHTFL